MANSNKTTATEQKSMQVREEENHSPKNFNHRLNQKVFFNPFTLYKGVIRRFVQLYIHVLGLILGGHIARVRNFPSYKRKFLRSPVSRFSAFILKPFVKRDLRNQPFEIQLRRRLEMLGPTYIKLGQIMAIREDLLPPNITSELQNLLDRLPEVPFDQILQIIETGLGRPIKELFIEIKEKPIGSASLGQTHRATTRRGKPVVLKVIKPGIRDIVRSDLKLLQILANFLEWFIPQYQPRMIVDEFANYTERELDLTFEADHAEIFAANFSTYPDIVFPKVYRELSSRDVLCMERIEGIKPNDSRTAQLSKKDKQKIIDLGAGAIIKMLYEDGFFHADLHAGNLFILPGPKIAFIDLGMVGRFEEQTRIHMLYYFYALVNNDIESSAKHLLAMARVGKGGDPAGFKRAVSDIFRRFRVRAAHGTFSIARVILESLSIGGKHHIFFPVEMTLMVKTLVTFEGVGRHFNVKLDIPKISRKHVNKIFYGRYDPKHLVEEFLRNMPELIDVIVRLPKLASDGSRSLERFLSEGGGDNPLIGIKSSVMSGAFVIAGVLALVQNAHPVIWIALFASSVVFFFFGK